MGRREGVKKLWPPYVHLHRLTCYSHQLWQSNQSLVIGRGSFSGVDCQAYIQDCGVTTGGNCLAVQEGMHSAERSSSFLLLSKASCRPCVMKFSSDPNRSCEPGYGLVHITMLPVYIIAFWLMHGCLLRCIIRRRADRSPGALGRNLTRSANRCNLPYLTVWFPWLLSEICDLQLENAE